MVLHICYASRINLRKLEKAKTVLHRFIEIVKESNRQPNKLWVDQREVLYNTPMKKWLDDNNFLMYSTYIKDKVSSF